MASSIEITFNSIPAADTVLSFTDSVRPSIPMILTFKAARTAIGECKIGSTNDGQAINYQNAFNSDYNNTALYTLTLAISPSVVLTIESNNVNSSFTLNSNTTSGALTTSIDNVTPPGVFAYDTVVISEAGSTPCTNVKFTVTTTEQADSIEFPISQAVATNPFVFETIRADAITLAMTKDSTQPIRKYRIPQLLSANIDVNVVNTPTGGTVTIVRNYPLSDGGDTRIFPLTFTYSLDGVNYQTSNSWSGIAAGSHTAYIKDNIGCEITIPFTVDAFTTNYVDYDDVFEVSNLNAIRYKKVETWANCGIKKTVENTLSHEENSNINLRNFVQWWQTCDTNVVTQVRTNYDTVTAKLIDVDGAETSLTVTQVTANMNITDVRDGTITVNSGNQIGVYFGSGNTYDSDTLAVNGSYSIGQSLMDWVNEGDYINIEGVGWALVTSIATPTTDIPFYVAYTANTNDGFFTEPYPTVKITTVYNKADFERYEFAMDCTSLDGFYQIQIDGTKTGKPDIQYLSEWQHIKTEHPKHFVIEYYNTKNNEINFGTGITFKLRIPYIVALKWKPNEEQEIYITDTRTIALENRVRKLYEMQLKPLPTAMAQKVILAISQNRVFIDGVNYVKEGESDVKQIGVTNTYLIIATLSEGNNVFDSNTAVSDGEVIVSGSPLSINSSGSGLLLVD